MKDITETNANDSESATIHRLVQLLNEWMQSAIECFETGDPHESEKWLAKVKEVGRAVFPCPKCHGQGGDCDAGDDGRTVSNPCQSCGESGYILPYKPRLVVDEAGVNQIDRVTEN
jgi:hypothetical protein